MKKLLPVLLGAAGVLSAVPALTQELPPPVPFETVGVKPEIDPGPNMFILTQSWDGASTFQVYDAVDFTYKGGMSTGSMAQTQLSAGGTRAYAIATYLDRITYGPTEMVLQVFDVATLSPIQEIALPPKIAMVGPYEHLLQLSADERFALVMNATPAASVTVVDLEAGAVTMEVPTPGCWSIYPATSGLKWTMLCGDGTARTYTMNAEGTAVTAEGATPIFSVDDDPLFVHAERGEGDELLFVSFYGNIYRVSDAGEAPELIESFSFTDDLGLPFGPSGYAVSAYNAANDVLFVIVHADPYDGSHKDPGDEVWVIDMETNALLYRLQIEPGAISLYVQDTETPALYVFNEEDYTVRRYVIDLDAPFGIVWTETAVVDVNGAQVITVRE